MTSGHVTQTNSPWQYEQDVEGEISYEKEHCYGPKTKQNIIKVL